MSRKRKNGTSAGSVTLSDIESIFLAIDTQLADPSTDYGTTKRLAERSKNLRGLAEVVRERLELDEAVTLTEAADRLEAMFERRLTDTSLPFDAPESPAPDWTTTRRLQ